MNSKWLGRSPGVDWGDLPNLRICKGGGDDSAPTDGSTGQQMAIYAYHHGIPTALFHAELWAYLSIVVFMLVLYSRLRPAEPRFALAAQVAVAACVISIGISSAAFQPPTPSTRARSSWIPASRGRCG